MKDPVEKRRILRRVADLNAGINSGNFDPIKAREVRESVKAYIKSLESGDSYYSDSDRKGELKWANGVYNQAVKMAKSDSTLPIGSNEVGGIAAKFNAMDNLFDYSTGDKPAKTAKPSTLPDVLPSEQNASSLPGGGEIPSRSGSTRNRKAVAAQLRAGIGTPQKSATAINPADFLPPATEANPYPTSVNPGTSLLDTKPAASGLSPTIGAKVDPAKVTQAAKAMMATGDGESGDGLSTAFNVASNVGSLLFGLMGANKGLPSYKAPYEWDLYGSRVKALADRGLSPESLAIAKNGLQSNFANTIASVRGVTGGGGSSAEAGANAADVASRFGPSYLNLAKLNQDTQRENLAPLEGYLRTNLGIDQQNFAREYNQAATAQNNYATIAANSLQGLADAPYENQNNALWDEYLSGVQAQRRLTRMALQKKNELATKSFE